MRRMAKHELRSRWQPDLPLTTPALMALVYVVLFRIYFIMSLCSLRCTVDGVWEWPIEPYHCTGLKWVIWCWIALLLMDGLDIATGPSRMKKTQLVGTGLALFCMLSLERVVTLIRNLAV